MDEAYEFNKHQMEGILLLVIVIQMMVMFPGIMEAMIMVVKLTCGISAGTISGRLQVFALILR